MGSSIGSIVGTVGGALIGGPAGAAIGGSLGGAAGNILGGSMQGSSSAQAQGNAGSSIYGAGQYGQQSSQFNPIGITTNFGKSNFTRDPNTGLITEAGYTLDPRLQGISDATLTSAGAYNPNQIAQAAQPLYGGASTAFGGGQNLFNLGSQYLAQSPEQARQDYINQQQALLAPGQEQQLASLRNQQFQTGRTGLATGGTTAGGLAQTNPELAAYYNSIANSNRQIAAGAENAAQQRQTFGAGLQGTGLGMFGTGASLLGQVPNLTTAGYSPLNTMLGTANTIEGMGQNAFDLSTTLGSGQSTANANAARFGLSGAQAAAPYQVANQSYNPLANVLQGSSAALGQASGQVGNWFNGLIGGGNSNNTSYFGGSGGGWTAQADSAPTAAAASDFYGSTYNAGAGWSA